LNVRLQAALFPILQCMSDMLNGESNER